jgi:hypothetical protein
VKEEFLVVSFSGGILMSLFGLFQAYLLLVIGYSWGKSHKEKSGGKDLHLA